MVEYDELLEQCYQSGLIVYELPLQYSSGMIYGKKIGIRSGMTKTKKKCVLAEELAHACVNTGNILDQSDVRNRKQEAKGRRLAYNSLIPLSAIVEAAHHGCRNLYETAQFLDVTEDFLEEALADFRKQYGTSVVVGDYAILFEPYMMVYDASEDCPA